MYTLNQIKDDYYTRLMMGTVGVMDFEEYLMSRFQRVYDGELNFIGYESIGE